MNHPPTNSVLAILDRSAVSAVVRAVLGRGGGVSEVNDAVALASAFERSAPDVLVVKSQIPWAPLKKLVSMVRRRWPECRVVVLGESTDTEVAATVPVDLSGLAGLPELLARLLSTDTIPTAMVDAAFGVIIGGGKVWRNDWLSRTFPGVRSTDDLIDRAEDSESIRARVEGGELVRFQVDDGSLLLDVVVVGDISIVVPATADVGGDEPEASSSSPIDIRRVAHDLIQPLRTAGYWIEKAGDDDEALDEAKKKALDEAKKILEHANKFVRGMTLGEEGSGSADLDVVMANVESMLGAAIAESGASLEIKSPLGVVAMDSVKVERVMQNLVSNAVRYGGPSVKIRVDSVQRGEWLEVTISNKGLGDSEQQGGTGLGLGIVRDTVSAAGGQFEFALSASGATATLRLKAASS